MSRSPASILGKLPAIPETDDDGAPFIPEANSLEALLRRATAATAADRRLREARKRLASLGGSHKAETGEAQRLVWEIRRLEEGRVWLTVARVAVFDTQVCDTCGARHEFFRGWMYEQKHTTDKTARKLVAELPGGSPPSLPERREDHIAKAVEVCGNCIESVIAIDIAAGNAKEAA